ncbi:MAG: efflux RND transporter permease subunit, partial [Rhodospirillales bacterium]|nr:efflux RND transporter permease subunit [Rhodospirillales bacterium]
RVPPRDSLKLIATATEALSRTGVDDPARHMALIRGLMTTTLIVKRSPLTEKDIGNIRDFSRSRSFDLAYLPGLNRAEANRFNRLNEPYFFDGAAALLGPDREAFLGQYKFDLRPATDDKPFFHHFMTASALTDLLAAGSAGLHLVEWGMPVAAATLVQAILLGGLLIILPLCARKGAGESLRSVSKARFAIYFLCLGLAFLIVELSFIHRFTVFLGDPVTSVAVVLAAFLVFAGIGAGLSARFARNRSRAIAASIGVLGFIAFAYLVALPGILGPAAQIQLAPRIALAAFLIAPLALAMGMPFPLALAQTSEAAPDAIPWAWAINGCASVVGAAAAPLLALQAGFSGSLIAAVVLYGFAALLFRWPGAVFSRYPRPSAPRP